MTGVVLEPPTKYWACPDCQAVDRTQIAAVHARLHQCAGHNGLEMPMVEVKRPDDRPDARHVMVEREDYFGNEITNPLAGKYMSVQTHHGDGSYDCAVWAPTAVGGAGAQ